MALDEADGTLPPLAWETPTILFEDYTLLQAVPSDADELAVLATATARVGHFGVDLRDNLHLTSDRSSCLLADWRCPLSLPLQLCTSV